MWGDPETARRIDERSDLVSLLFQTTGPSHIPKHDELFQDLLSHYNVWIHVAIGDGDDSSSSSEAIKRTCQLTIQHAPRTSNLASLIWNITQMLQQVVVAGNGNVAASRRGSSSDTTMMIDSSFSYVAKARSIAGSLRLARLLLHAVISSYVGSPRRSLSATASTTTSSSLLANHQQQRLRLHNRSSFSKKNNSNGNHNTDHHSHNVEDRLQQALTYKCRTNNTETDVGPLFVNALVDYLTFTARHSQNQEYDYDARCETIQLMLVLLSTQLYSPLQTSFVHGGGIEPSAPTHNGNGSKEENVQQPRYSFWKPLLSRGDITLVLLNITVERPQPSIRSIQYNLMKQSGKPAGPSSTTSLLFWLPYRLVSLALSLWRSSTDTISTITTTDDTTNGHHHGNTNSERIDLSPLADLATLLLLVLTNAKRAVPQHHPIRQTLAAVMDSRYYPADTTKYRINYEDWFDSFERTLQQPAAALWFYTVLQGSPQFHEYLTLRSDLDRLVLPLLQTTSRERFHLYMILILLLLFSQESSFGNDAFRRIKVDDFNLGTVILLAVIDLMENYPEDEFLTANCHAVITNLAASAVDLPGEEALLRHADILESAIHRGNPEFILELMKRFDAQRRHRNKTSELKGLKKRDEKRLEYACEGLDLRREKKEVLLQAISTRLKDREATTETFTYQEEEDPEIFFVPYVWQVVVESNLSDIPWDRRRIKVYEGVTPDEATAEIQNVSHYSNDVGSIV